MRKLYFILLFLGSILYTARLKAQSTSYAYDKEKIYVQTDHVFFSPGGTVFFKIYLVKGADNRPSKLSKVVYIEIMGPSGTVVEKQTYQAENGYSEGSYTLGDQAAGGIYKLKAYTSWMLNEKDSTLFTKTFTVQRIISPRVLMKLDFPQKGYGPGAAVLASFSMRSLDDRPIRDYNGEFVVSLDGHSQEKKTFTTDATGKAQLSFILPPSLHTTDGLLNVTVTYDAHTESISRSIPITLNKVDLQFLPEGGAFVGGLATNMAFKAVNEFGKPVDVKGVVRDSHDQVVASFDSYKFGMGAFPFTPRSGERYTATITEPANIQQSYTLPEAITDGIVMNMSVAANLITIKCNTPSATTVRLVGRAKGVTWYAQDLPLKKGLNEIPINEKLFPPGIAQFTLYTSGRRPLAERLIFLNQDRHLHVTISTNKQRYLPREEVLMTISTRDEHGQPVPSNFSLSVVDDKLWTMADDRQDNIYSWLLMSSELHGQIEEPAFYFKKDEPMAARALDLVMLTNGYRYFDFTDEVTRQGALKFTPDEGNIVSGIVTNAKGRPVPASVFLINNAAMGKALKLEAGADGLFYFPNMIEGGSYILIAQALHRTGEVKIRVEQNGIGHDPLRVDSIRRLRVDDKFGDVIKPLDKAVSPVAAFQPRAVNLAINFGSSPKALSEVVVTGYGVMRKQDVVGSVAVVNNYDLRAVQANNVAQVLQGKVAGLVVTQKGNPGDLPQVQVRGSRTLNGGNEPLIVVDGVPQEKFDLRIINVSDIESVTVLKDAAAVALYGARAANGVISIQTKGLRFERLKFDITRKSPYTTSFFQLQGPTFTVARRFYAPQYKSTVTDKRDDYRETIYWNPVVQTGRDGKATMQFYNSDATTTFRVIAEGIGYNGRPGRADTTYSAQAAMSVDAKIPPYLTVGDQARIPVFIKNNSDDKLEATVNVTLPDNMHTGSFDNKIILAPGTSRQLLIPVSATAPASGKIGIYVSSNSGNETIVLPISAAGKGFPVIETFSGNANAKRELQIGSTVPGSLYAKLTLFKDVEGQLMNGIESLLREPYGCFEQTSSMTYPNVFILKYLRQSGKSNTIIEQKAMNYIGQGYKKLIGFETAEHGFEWFGHTPAHAALTAYGLLEFTDMQEFLEVDKNMLKRTKDFLLSRRDGQGGFKTSNRGYDNFASVPDRLAHTYIVYALSQAGYGDEIKPEYASAVKKALESKDSYQLAMMALAADNMKRDDDYGRLMEQLNLLYKKHDLWASTTVVNSFDASLRVETMSLYAMAVMRSKTPDMATAAALISKILEKKSYYGFGSTQGTVLALQAITEYTRRANELARSTDLRLTVSGRTLTPDDSIATYLHTGANTLAVEYADSGKGAPFNIEIAYQTFTPPNSQKTALSLNTAINNTHPSVGETVRMTITASNVRDTLQPMAIAKIGIPAGLSLQPWQLKELTEHKQLAYYEIFDNYLVLYWMGFAPDEVKTIHLDLKAEIPGTYKAKASNVYLYYTPEKKFWSEGAEVEIGGD